MIMRNTSIGSKNAVQKYVVCSTGQSDRARSLALLRSTNSGSRGTEAVAHSNHRACVWCSITATVMSSIGEERPLCDLFGVWVGKLRFQDSGNCPKGSLQLRQELPSVLFRCKMIQREILLHLPVVFAPWSVVRHVQAQSLKTLAREQNV